MKNIIFVIAALVAIWAPGAMAHTDKALDTKVTREQACDAARARAEARAKAHCDMQGGVATYQEGECDKGLKNNERSFTVGVRFEYTCNAPRK